VTDDGSSPNHPSGGGEGRPSPSRDGAQATVSGSPETGSRDTAGRLVDKRRHESPTAACKPSKAGRTVDESHGRQVRRLTSAIQGSP
jgi:hypothetical protein